MTMFPWDEERHMVKVKDGAAVETIIPHRWPQRLSNRTNGPSSSYENSIFILEDESGLLLDLPERPAVNCFLDHRSNSSFGIR